MVASDVGWLFVLVIGLLVMLNGIFVAAEFAIIGAPRAAIEHRAARGERRAGAVRRILHDPASQDRYVATAQIGITVASLGLGMYGEHALAERLAEPLEGLGAARWVPAHAAATVIAVTLLTYVHIVIGEMVPKSIALQRAERAVLSLTPLMVALRTAIYPLVVLLNGIGNLILRLLGIHRQQSASHYHTTEELQYIVAESQEGGLLRHEAGEVLQELFEFGELTAGEVMVPRVQVVGIPADATTDDIRAIVRRERHTRYPVYDGDLDHLIGMLHIKDLLRLLVEGRSLATVRLRPLPLVPHTADLDTVLETMRRERTHMVVVMDEYGGTAGVLTIEDLFEEVVGEIEETPYARPELVRDGAGRLHVDGTVRIEEVGEALDRTLEHEDVDTVSGLVLALLGRPPRVGDVVTFESVAFTVTEVEGHGVRRAVVVPPPPAPPHPGDA